VLYQALCLQGCGQGIFPGVGVLDACKSAGVHSLPPFLSLTGEEGVCIRTLCLKGAQTLFTSQREGEREREREIERERERERKREGERDREKEGGREKEGEIEKERET
jgi:hypothetical protein